MKIGIIGGSGLENPGIMHNARETEMETPYGKPSSSITEGKISGLDVCILSRHGRKHEITPTHVNNRANIYALKKLGVTHILATTAVGSLKQYIQRGDFVVLNQFIDFTRHRNITFYDSFKDKPEHTSLADPFSEFLREKLIKACREQGIKVHETGTVITIEGPRFSTRAESNLFRSWGADVINMSIAPEAILSREAGIEYAVIAMSTDYDCWKSDELPVSWQGVLKIFNENAEKVKSVLLRTIEILGKETLLEKDTEFIKNKIRTIPNWPKPGVMFRDITTLLINPEALNKVLDIFTERYKHKEIDLIAGIESRGFVIASALASRLGKGLVLVRKPGKLPAETLKEEYSLEYGTDSVEIHKDAINPGQKVLVIDDLIATGGTALATCNLIEKLKGIVVECAFIVELPELKGKEKLSKWNVFKIVEFEGE